MRVSVVLAMLLAAPAGFSQWAMQESGVKASLRGIDNVGGGVAWASGSEGTVLRTVDGGKSWQKCAVPVGAEKLDFRGVQAFDATTAIVMSSGPGDLSRLYKTVDGCGSWKMVFTNPDKDGFWDAIAMKDGQAVLIGDPVAKRFVIYGSVDGQLEKWDRLGEISDLNHFRIDFGPSEGEGLFAASNSVLIGSPRTGVEFVTGGPDGAFFGEALWKEGGVLGASASAKMVRVRVPVASGQGAGAFSFGKRDTKHYVAVGGDYTKPDVQTGTAAFSTNGAAHWQSPSSNPHGYRSAVAYEANRKTWVTVGPNGTDVSTDDGKNWRALRPSAEDAVDADKNWNALSLPFVVGSKGRIGVLRDGAVAASK